MSTYVYDLPSTSPTSFSDCYLDRSPSSSSYSSSSIPECTQKRADMRTALKECKKADDWLRVVKAIEEYLPYLRGLVGCVDHDLVTSQREPGIAWKPTLSNHALSSSTLSYQSLYFELTMTLLTYGCALASLASAILPPDTRGKGTLDDEERKKAEDTLGYAVNHLCRAAGVFSAIGERVLNKINNEEDKRPVELKRDMYDALSKLSLADAQSLAIRKYLSKPNADALILHGPPLPKSHPPPALIAKLHLGCTELYSSARSLLKSLSPSSSVKLGKLKSVVEGDVKTELKKYMGERARYHGAMAKMWLGIDAGEQGGDQAGEAVAWLSWAKKELEECEDGSREEGARVKELVKYYKKMNDSLTFRPVPPQTSLAAKIPAGRMAVNVKPYIDEQPEFGPGSRNYTALTNTNEDGDDQLEPDITNQAPRATQAQYAGQGAYF